jgi:hypothetical protein
LIWSKNNSPRGKSACLPISAAICQRGVVSEIADETLYGFFLVLTPPNSTPLFSAMATDDSGPGQRRKPANFDRLLALRMGHAERDQSREAEGGKNSDATDEYEYEYEYGHC